MISDAWLLVRHNRYGFIVPNLPSKQVKAALTRAYNKEPHLAPYALSVVAKKSRKGSAPIDGEELVGEERMSGNSTEDECDVETDGMVKVGCYSISLLSVNPFIYGKNGTVIP